MSQANVWGRYYDEAKVDGIEEPAAIAWTRFKKVYSKDGDRWVRMEANMDTLPTVTIDIPIFDTADPEAIARGWKPEYLEDVVRGFSLFYERIKPPVKIGHNEEQPLAKAEPRRDGQPAFGWAESVRQEGTRLYAKFKGVPRKLAQLINSGAWKRVSSEFYVDVTDDQHGSFKRLLRAVSLLGQQPPSIKSLDDVVALYGENDAFLSYAVEEFGVDIVDGNILVEETALLADADVIPNGLPQTDKPENEKPGVDEDQGLLESNNKEVVMDKEKEATQEPLPGIAIAGFTEVKSFDGVSLTKEEYSELIAIKATRDQVETARVAAEAALFSATKAKEEFAEKLAILEVRAEEIAKSESKLRNSKIELLCEEWQKAGKLDGNEKPVMVELLRRSDEKTTEKFGEEEVSMWDMIVKFMEARKNDTSVPMTEVSEDAQEDKIEALAEESIVDVKGRDKMKNVELNAETLKYMDEHQGVSYSSALDAVLDSKKA